MRTDILFNQGWEFLLSDKNPSLKSDSSPDAELSQDVNSSPNAKLSPDVNSSPGDEKPFLQEIWKTVSLPHDWDVEYEPDENAPSGGGGGYARAGIGWYRKRFSLTPQEIADRHVSLLFEGVYMNASVWLNGVFLGHHNYGYTPFIISLDEALLTGKSNEESSASLLNQDKENATLHLLPHWNWPGQEGQFKHVVCYTNCEEVALYLSGRLVGRKGYVIVQM